MNIFDIAKQFFIVVDKVGYEEVVVFEPDNGIITAQTMLSEDEYQFSVDTQAELWDNGKFYVKSVDGEDVPFIAYQRVDWNTESNT